MEKKHVQQEVSWVAREEPKDTKSVDWFWTVGAISLAVALGALLVHNWLFSILIILAGITIILGAVKKPQPISATITSEGLVVNKQLFTYNNLTSFWIEEEYGPATLTVGVKGSMLPRLSVPLGNADIRAIRTALSKHIPQERYEKSLSELVGDRLGIQ